MQDKYYADFFLPSDLFSFIMKESFCAGLSLAREQQQKIHYLIFCILIFRTRQTQSDSSLIKYLSLPSASFTVTVI